MFPRLLRALLLTMALSVNFASAQSPADEEQAVGVIHVSVNLLQIPVLVLDSFRHPMRPLAASRFTVSLQGLPPFTPRLVRTEGDDPISLAIVLDHSDPEETLWENLPRATEKLVGKLNADDRVEVYGIDGCKLRRFLLPSAPSALTLKNALGNAVSFRPFTDADKKKQCAQQPVTLWESMLYASRMLQQRDGRRILLVLSNGQRAAPNEVMDSLLHLMNSASIAAFAVRHGEAGMSAFMVQLDGGRVVNTSAGSSGNAPVGLAAHMTWSGYPLGIEAELSGGMVLGSTIQSLPGTLATVIDRVRGRYILEFSRPAGLGVGAYRISISTGQPRDFIRPSGISVPVATAREVQAERVIEPVAPVFGSTGSDAPEASAPTPAAPRRAASPADLDVPRASQPVMIDPNDITDDLRPVPPVVR